MTGEIEQLTLDDPANIYSGGRIVVGGVSVILPKNLLIDLPANRLSLTQIFRQAPAGCVAAGQSGLAKTDTCNATGAGGNATITAVHTNAGDLIAGDVFIQKGIEAVTGAVTFINYTDGYFRVNGTTGVDAGGVMVRLNDPDAVHSIQQGAGCAGGPNCSADPRFTLDGENYVIAFSTGYPVCIPSTKSRPHPAFPAVTGVAAIPAGTTQSDANGAGDVLCPSTNRTPASLIEPPVADSRRFAPIVVGDSITAEGNFEIIGGVKFLSTHTMRVNKALGTRNSPDQPDYLFLEEVFIEAPAFQNQRIRAMWIGFTTLAPTDVDIWSIHRDPATNAVHEIPLASVLGCETANQAGTCGNQGLVNAGANIFRIRYDVDFLMARQGFPGGTKDAKLSPCLQIMANPRWSGLNLCSGVASLANNFAVMSPVPHEIQARTGHLLQNPALAGVTVDVSGNPATNGQYLFPLGMNLGGIEVAEMTEIDLNLLFTPTIFEGIPWNLDRRLGPSGCLDNNGNPAACPAGPIPLDPFPYTGLDPRAQTDFLVGGLPGGLPTGSFSTPSFTASTLSNVRDRIFSYVDAALGKPNGNSTVLPYALGTFPADPPQQPAGTVPPPLAVGCVAGGIAPVAQDDRADTTAGTAVTINVLANDIAPVGALNFASVVIVSGPIASAGTATANPDGTVTFTPDPAFRGTATFTYTVAELTFGGVSNRATVTVSVAGPILSLSTQSLTFADQAINTVSTAQTVTVTNTGFAPLIITDITKGGRNQFQFTRSYDCPIGGAGLAAGQSCTITVKFKPTVVGTMKAFVAVNVVPPAVSKSIALHGVAIP